jgi:hypothetical protein
MQYEPCSRAGGWNIKQVRKERAMLNPGLRMVCLLLAVSATVFVTADVSGQNTISGAIQGQVIDFDTKMPIAGAVIIAKDEESGTIKSTRSFKDGNYRISNLPSGTYILRCEHPDYGADTYPGIPANINYTKTVKIPPFLLHKKSAAVAAVAPPPKAPAPPAPKKAAAQPKTAPPQVADQRPAVKPAPPTPGNDPAGKTGSRASSASTCSAAYNRSDGTCGCKPACAHPGGTVRRAGSTAGSGSTGALRCGVQGRAHGEHGEPHEERQL